MDAQDVKGVFDGITEFTKNIIARKLSAKLAHAITEVNKDLAARALNKLALCPPVGDIFSAFKHTPLENVSIVILGQDPYIKAGEADGKSFSVRRGVTIPPSLRNIFQCWLHYGFIKALPKHGDLTNIAKQGVLFLNAALTTRLGASNAHATMWSDYVDALLGEISQLPQSIIFIALGRFAKTKMDLIDRRRHIVLEWGHPSPLNSANNNDNPAHFKYCTAFKRANDMLVLSNKEPIHWDPDYEKLVPLLNEKTEPQYTTAARAAIDSPKLHIIEKDQNARDQKEQKQIDQKDQIPYEQAVIKEVSNDDPCPLTIDTLWVFYDGGATGNGRAHCKASYAFYVTDGCVAARAGGLVQDVYIPGQVYRASNQRGELTGLLEALKFVCERASEFSFKNIKIVYDNEYSVKCITEWINNWIAKDKLSEKANIDLIVPAKEYYDSLDYDIEFIHQYSHQNEPADQETEEYFKWKGNDIVDSICAKYTPS